MEHALIWVVEMLHLELADLILMIWNYWIPKPVAETSTEFIFWESLLSIFFKINFDGSMIGIVMGERASSEA